ncbi:ABC-type multidrug transport system, ATPase component [Caldisphaera lagunensis DSM 15908]|uniref:ABC-type multidrug transport system, ATPase component n=1 Tax=Caldisphaera lagunensis (strain DSM 15908 / JCM 11604 / ANMR 0165 / IC-154) TaxID=1056495 RepID=L0ACM2_CALLD|nr:ABC transporter ATP-binding protein [Caldisphaera lagunensis]AFZ71174.1 ABC-type multidrug transport system, ATPase component [Caldisphaera lagunensis DSM 15908]
MGNEIVTINLCREFRSNKKIIKALNNINMEIPKGVTAALVGPNGAGKTTLIKILSTLMLPTSGTAYVHGFDIIKETKNVRASIGLATGGERTFYFRLTGYENLLFFASLYGLPLKDTKSKSKELLDIVGLSDFADYPYMKYSLGMQRRLALARALINDPPILLLDEPTLGIDPISAREFRRLIKMISSKKTILLTSHYMGEIEELSDIIFLIKDGKIILKGTSQELKNKIGKIIEVIVPATLVSDNLSKYVVGIRANRAYLRIPKSLIDQIDGKSEIIGETDPTLEDVYAALIGSGPIDKGTRVKPVRFGRWQA